MSFDIRSPLTPTYGGKIHCLLITEDSTDYAWSSFLKEKLELKKTMLGIIKDLKANYSIHVQYARCDNARENSVLKGHEKRKGWVLSSSTLLHVLHNKMVMLNKNLPHSSIGKMPCSTVGSFPPF